MWRERYDLHKRYDYDFCLWTRPYHREYIPYHTYDTLAITDNGQDGSQKICVRGERGPLPLFSIFVHDYSTGPKIGQQSLSPPKMTAHNIMNPVPQIPNHQFIAIYCNSLQFTAIHRNSPQFTAIHRNSLQFVAIRCKFCGAAKFLSWNTAYN